MSDSGEPATPPADNVARVIALADVVGLTVRPDDLPAVAEILGGILAAGERLQRDLPIDIVPTEDPHWPDDTRTSGGLTVG